MASGDTKSHISAHGRKCSALACADPASAKNLLSGTNSPGGNIKHIVVDYSNQEKRFSSPRWNNTRKLVNSRQGSDHTIPGHHIVSINSTNKSSELMNQSMPKQRETNSYQQENGQVDLHKNTVNTVRIQGAMASSPNSTQRMLINDGSHSREATDLVMNGPEDGELPNFGMLTDREF